MRRSIATQNKLYWVVCLLAGTLAGGCDRIGSYNMKLVWADGEPAIRPLYVRSRVEHRPEGPTGPTRTVLAAVGPVPYEGIGSRIDIPIVPVGTNRVLIVEVLRFPNSQVPLYYGISESFTTSSKKNVQVEMLLQPTRAPAGPADGAFVYVVTPNHGGAINQTDVSLRLASDRGVEAWVSSDITFPEDERTWKLPLDTLAGPEDVPGHLTMPDGLSLWALDWDLDGPYAEGCPVPGTCMREIFVQVRDAYGYGSEPIYTTVLLDTEPPTVSPESTIQPDIVPRHFPIEVTVVTNERVRPTPVVEVAGVPEVTFESHTLPDVAATAWRYLSAPLSRVIPDNGTYTVTVELVDLAGNRSSPLDVGTVTLDVEAPVIDNLSLQPQRVRTGDEVTAMFTLYEDPVDLTVSVYVDTRRIDCPVASGAPPLTVMCTWTMTDEDGAPDEDVTVPVWVTARDAAANETRLNAPLQIDRAPPVLKDAVFSPRVASSGRNVFFEVDTFEPLAGPPMLHWQGTNPGFVYDAELSGPTRAIYRWWVPPNAISGMYVVEAVTLSDDLGNAHRVVTNPESSTLIIDVDPPGIEDLTLHVAGTRDIEPARASGLLGHTAEATFTLVEADPQVVPTMVLEEGFFPGTCQVQGGVLPRRQWQCLYALTGSEIPPGTTLYTAMLIRAEDAARNLAEVRPALVLDFEPPTVDTGTVLVRLIPEASNPIQAPTAAKVGTRVEVSFEATETLWGPPSLQTQSPDALIFTLERQQLERRFTMVHAVSSGAPEGLQTPEVTLTDEVGHVVTVPVPEASFVIDTTPPPAPAVDVADRIVFERTPWGSTDSGGQPRFRLTGQPGAVESDAVVTISEASRGFRRNVVASANGSFGPLDLGTGDVPTVELEAIDGAGNVGPRRAVRDGRWVATFYNKEKGRTAVNPHRATWTPEMQLTFGQAPPGGLEEELETADYQALSGPGNGLMQREARQTWRQLTIGGAVPGGVNGQLYGHALAYDRKRGRLVVFGGTDGQTVFDETWEWDGDQWHLQTPVGGLSPSARVGGLMVYSPIEDAVLVYGGRVGGQWLGDLWAWNGTAWRQLSTGTPGPGGRRGASLSYDPERGEVLLFGGFQNNFHYSDLWAWDGTAWQRKLTLGTPGGRTGAVMAPLGGDMVLFGGQNGAQLFGDTWVWNGNIWQSITPASSPSARAFAGITYDQDLDRVMLFGGFGASGASNELWSWDGSQWQSIMPRNPSGTSFPRPAPRGTPIAYDVKGRRLIVLDGLPAGGIEGELWTFDRSAYWRIRSSRRVHSGSPIPPARSRHAMASNEGGTVIFGGVADDMHTQLLGDTWIWAGAEWEQEVPSSGLAPSARMGAKMASRVRQSLSAGEMILFGGQTEIDTSRPVFSNETWRWIWDTPRGRWELISTRPANTPPPRAEHGMAYDAVRDVVVMWGGRGGSMGLVVFDDLYEWDGLNWTQRLPDPTCPSSAWPTARFGHIMAYDENLQRVVMWGGRLAAGNDTNVHVWDGRCWAQFQSATRPPTREYAAGWWVPNRARILVFGGRSLAQQGPLLQDLWAWNGMIWREATPFIQPNLWGLGTAVVAEPDGTILLFGGQDIYGPTQDTWSLSSPQDQRPAMKGTIDWFAAQVAIEAVTQVDIDAFGGGMGAAQNGVGPAQGLSVWVWSPRAGQWMHVGQHVSASPAPLHFSTMSVGGAQSLIEPFAEAVNVLVAPQGTDRGAIPATMEIDDIFITVHYRLTP